MDERIRNYRQAQRTAMGKTLAGAYDIGQGMDPKSQASMTYRHFGGPEMSKKDREQLMLQYTQLASELQQSAQRLQSRGSRATRGEVGEFDRTWEKLTELMGKALSPQATVASKKIESAAKKRDHHLATIDQVRATNPALRSFEELKPDQRKAVAQLEGMWKRGDPNFGNQLSLSLEKIEDPSEFSVLMDILGKRLVREGHLTLEEGQTAREGVRDEALSTLSPSEQSRLEDQFDTGEQLVSDAMKRIKDAQGEADAAEKEIQRHVVGVDAESRELLRVLTEQKIAQAKLKTGVLDKLAAGEEVDPTALQFAMRTSTAVAAPGLTPMEVTEEGPEQPYDYMKKALDRLSVIPDDRSLSGLRQEMMASDGFAQYMADREFQDEDFAFRQMMREYNKKRRQAVRSDRLKVRQQRIQARGEGIADQMIGVEPVDDYTRREAARIADVMEEPREGAEVTLGGRDVGEEGRPSIRERLSIRDRAQERLRERQAEQGVDPRYQGTLPELIEEDLELADMPEEPAVADEAALAALDPEAELSEAEKAEIVGAQEPVPGFEELRADEAAEEEFIAPAEEKFMEALGPELGVTPGGEAEELLGGEEIEGAVPLGKRGIEDIEIGEEAGERREREAGEAAVSAREVEGRLGGAAARKMQFAPEWLLEPTRAAEMAQEAEPSLPKREEEELGEVEEETAPEEELGEVEEETAPVGVRLQSSSGLGQAALESSSGGLPNREDLLRARNRAIQASLVQ